MLAKQSHVLRRFRKARSKHTNVFYLVTGQLNGYSFSADGPTHWHGKADFTSANQHRISITRNEAYLLLQECIKRNDLECGRRLQFLMLQNGLDSVAPLGDHLIRLFANHETLIEANQAFKKIAEPSLYTWCAIILANTKLGQAETGLDFYSRPGLLALGSDKYVHVAILKACTITKALAFGRKTHYQISEVSLQLDVVVGSALVDMYAKCGQLGEAWEVFDKLIDKDVVSWNAIITGFADHGKPYLALECLELMQQEGLSPNEVTFSNALRACVRLGSLEQGKTIHDKVRRSSIKIDNVLANTLIDMYAKCGSLEKAHEVFEKLPYPDLVLWNTMLAGYTQHSEGYLALECFYNMQLKCLKPNEVTFSSILSACAIGSFDQGKLIHGLIIQSGYKVDVVMGNTLVHMYAKCGRLEEARKVFELYPNQNVATWNTMIAGYALHSEGGMALQCFGDMEQKGICPNEITFVSVTKACGSLGAMACSRLVHSRMASCGLQFDVVLGSSIVDMYIKCESLDEAHKVFEKINQNVVSWGAMIAGYVQHGFGSLALECFKDMQMKGIIPNLVIFLSVLKACASICALEKGRVIHQHIIACALTLNPPVSNALIDMYAKCGSLEEAQGIFEKLSDQDTVSWNVMMAQYAQHGKGLLSLECFEQMQEEGISINEVTFLSALGACASIKDIIMGRFLHAMVAKVGMESDLIVGSTLVDMYAKCASLNEAYHSFSKLPQRDVVSWNGLISAYAQQEESFLALQCLVKMEQEGIVPNKITVSIALKACANAGAIEQGRFVHRKIIEWKFDSDIIVNSSLVDMYARCGSLEEAQRVFNQMREKDLVLWNTVIAGYSQHDEGLLAIECYAKMQEEGVKPNEITYLSILRACSTLGAVEHARHIHNAIRESGLQLDLAIGSALIDTYAKCGSLEKARELFMSFPNRDLMAWGAMLAGYAQHGEGFLALECFKNMQQGGIIPDEMSLTSILIACSRAGLVDEGIWHFQTMIGHHSTKTTTTHYICIVDLLGRAGFLSEAEDLLLSIYQTDVAGWMSLLSACRMQGHIDLGMRCFSQIDSLGNDSSSGYVLLSNIYADAEIQDFLSSEEA